MTTAEKLNIKVFLGDSLTPEDFSFSQLSSSTNTGSIIPPTTNDLWFSSTQPIPTHIDESERINFFTEQGKYNQYMGSVKKVEPDKIRETFNNNIMTVLFYLFPTYYKSTPNIHNSYDDRVPHNGVEKINAPILQKYKKVSDGDVVYYKGNTVLQLTWKNDVFNVPEFQTLFSAIYKFYVWSKTQGMQKTNTALERIVEIKAKSSVGQELVNKIKELGNKTTDDRRYSSTKEATENQKKEVKGIFEKLKTSYEELQKNYTSRNEQEKKEKTPETEKVASEQEYDKQQQTVVTEITAQISKLKLYDEHERDSSRRTSLADTVNGIIGQFKDLIVNRSIYKVFEKNEYIFSTGSSNDVVILSKDQQDIYKYLTENYPEYAKMAEAVKNFREVVKKTANSDLDTLCNNFFNNNNRNLLYFILHIQKNFLYSTQGNIVLESSFENITNEIGEYSNSAELYYVGGINQKSNGNWLIYIGLDAIRGKVNQKKVKECLFGNERLGNLFVDLTATAQKALVKNYFYDVIADGSPDVSTGGPQGGGTRKQIKRRRKKRVTKTRRKK